MLQTDGYAAYKTLAGRNRQVTLAHCWSHLRRKFFDLAKGGSAPIATEALKRIGELYAIEADIRGQSAEARAAARQQRSTPLVDALNAWFAAQLARVPGRSPVAEVAGWDRHTRGPFRLSVTEAAHDFVREPAGELLAEIVRTLEPAAARERS